MIIPIQPQSLDQLLTAVRACRACADVLPLGPRPIVQAGSKARILIIGQAPGLRVHRSGIPWNDASGTRLRQWLQMAPETFYDPEQVAIIPMGYCYPGRGKSGDLPPRPECARLWLDDLLAHLPAVELTLLIGQYAQRHFLGKQGRTTLTETVRAWQDYGPRFFPLPHPSPRNVGWFLRNPWFEQELLPHLHARLREAASP